MIEFECRGPTGKQLNELADASRNPTNCEIIFVSLSDLSSQSLLAQDVVRMFPLL